MVRWSDTFWGEGNRGFEILSTNVKNGAIAIEEFQRFLNERYLSKCRRFVFQCLFIGYCLVHNMNLHIVKIYLVCNHNYWKCNMLEHSHRSGSQYGICWKKLPLHIHRLSVTIKIYYAKYIIIMIYTRRKWKHLYRRTVISLVRLISFRSWITLWIRWIKRKNNIIRLV